MAVITNISKQAEKALRDAGIKYEYGYGDAYHFNGLAGSSSVDIVVPFTVGGNTFVAVGEKLMLKSEQVIGFKRYRKKPVVVSALQWFKQEDYPDVVRPYTDLQNKTVEGVHFSAQLCEHCHKSKGEHGWIKTLEGGHIVCPGDWIIRGVQGEMYPCKPDVFEATYGPA